MFIPKMNYAKKISVVGTGIFVFVLYLPTVAPDLTWFANSGDGGELITAAVTLGIPHPPGYPTYVLLGKLVSYLPFEPIAYRFHLFSAFCTAVSAAFVAATLQLYIPQPATKQQLLLATVPAYLFAFSPLVWQQAIVAEVYALNLAVVAAFLWALLGKRPFLLVGFLLGLSLTTHLTSFLLLPLAIAATPWAKSWKLATGILLGLSPFLLLPILAQQGSPVIWGNPTTVRGWWWLVSAEIYHANQFGLPLSSLWPKLTNWGNSLTLSFLGWPLLLYSGWQLRKRHSPEKNRWWLLVGTAVFYLGYAFFYNTQDSIVLILPAFLIFSLCLMPALEKIGGWGFWLLGITLLLHLSSNNGANVHNVRLQAEQILNLSPPKAILITEGDPDIFSLWYFHHVEGQRPDIILVDEHLFGFDWYRYNLQQRYTTLRALEEDNLPLFQTENERQRPICRAFFQEDAYASANIHCLEGR